MKKTTFGRTLLEICEVQAAKADSLIQTLSDDTGGDEKDDRAFAGVEVAREDDCLAVPSSDAAVPSEDDRRGDSYAADQQRVDPSLLEAITWWLVVCLVVSVVPLLLALMRTYLECGENWKCWDCHRHGWDWTC